MPETETREIHYETRDVEIDIRETVVRRDAPSVFIVIPAYNEETVIGDVIAEIRQAGYDNIVVVDDGSKDATYEKVKETGAEALRHLINRGQGAALRTGINYASETYDPDIIVTFDADGQHRAEDIGKLIQPILHGNADIVLGSRFLDSHDNIIPFTRKLMLRCAVLFTNIISHIHLTDTHNGLRALNRRAYRSIKIFHRGMEHASDIIDEISRNRLRYQEVPVHIAYSKYSLGKGQRTSNFAKIAIKIILKKIL
jgi:glycosyltransferase involved in cell wall biosynthesis